MRATSSRRPLICYSYHREYTFPLAGERSIIYTIYASCAIKSYDEYSSRFHKQCDLKGWGGYPKIKKIARKYTDNGHSFAQKKNNITVL